MNQMNPYMPYSKNKRRAYQYYIPRVQSKQQRSNNGKHGSCKRKSGTNCLVCGPINPVFMRPLHQPINQSYIS